MRRRNNLIVALMAGLGLFVLGLSGVPAPKDEATEWLVAYRNAMQDPERQ